MLPSAAQGPSRTCHLSMQTAPGASHPRTALHVSIQTPPGASHSRTGLSFTPEDSLHHVSTETQDWGLTPRGHHVSILTLPRGLIPEDSPAMRSYRHHLGLHTQGQPLHVSIHSPPWGFTPEYSPCHMNIQTPPWGFSPEDSSTCEHPDTTGSFPS